MITDFENVRRWSFKDRLVLILVPCCFWIMVACFWVIGVDLWLVIYKAIGAIIISAIVFFTLAFGAPADGEDYPKPKLKDFYLGRSVKAALDIVSRNREVTGESTFKWYPSRIYHRHVLEGKAIYRFHDNVKSEEKVDFGMFDEIKKMVGPYKNEYYRICNAMGSFGHSYTFSLFLYFIALRTKSYEDEKTNEKLREELKMGALCVVHGVMNEMDYVRLTDADRCATEVLIALVKNELVGMSFELGEE
ncbi:hypothetical protein A3715_11405 [Oleiphilus sp. HI0009]|nr:hypothetical protein A3715_11405 [Oleiphilus sp. HI0009]